MTESPGKSTKKTKKQDEDTLQTGFLVTWAVPVLVLAYL